MCKNQSVSPKRGIIKFKLPKNSAVFHLPLEEMPSVKTWTSNVKRNGKTKAKWYFEVCSLQLFGVNLSLNVFLSQ